MVAGPGLRSPIKRDYEPREILTSHPHVKEQEYYSSTMFHYVYILRSFKDGKFYTGVTSDLRKRVKTHDWGMNVSTKYRRPLRLVYYEAYMLEDDAKAREKYLKTSMGKRVLKKQLSHFLKLSF